MKAHPLRGGFCLAVVITAVVSVGALSASAARRLRDDPGRESPQALSLPSAGTVYTIRARIVPESLTVRGHCELDYLNVSTDSLREILFLLGGPAPDSGPSNRFLSADCQWDSILYQGVPLTGDELRSENGTLAAVLPAALAPGERAFFFLAFVTRLGGADRVPPGCNPLELVAWYPRVSPYRNGRWLVSAGSRPEKLPADFAAYNVALKIDTAYDVAFPGQLVNEKEHFGLLPRPQLGDIWVDLACNYGHDLSGQLYQPVFTAGEKEYFVRLKQARDFSAFVAREYVQDRGHGPQMSVSVHYPSEAAPLWSRFVAASTMDVVEYYEHLLGPCPHQRLTVVRGGIGWPARERQPLVVLPCGISDRETLLAALALATARCWVPPVLPGDAEMARDNELGLAAYLASTWLYARFGADGYQWLESVLRQVLANTRPPRRQAREATRDVLAWLHLVRWSAGERLFWEALKTYLTDHRFAYASGDEFRAAFDEPALGHDLIRLRDIPELLAGFDPRVHSVAVKRLDGNFRLSGVLDNLSEHPVPIEIGLAISPTDTVYDTLRYQSSLVTGHSLKLSWELNQRPEAIVLDPNHRLPDRERGNNYGFTRPSRFRYLPPTALFPGYTDPSRR